MKFNKKPFTTGNNAVDAIIRAAHSNPSQATLGYVTTVRKVLNLAATVTAIEFNTTEAKLIHAFRSHRLDLIHEPGHEVATAFASAVLRHLRATKPKPFAIERQPQELEQDETELARWLSIPLEHRITIAIESTRPVPKKITLEEKDNYPERDIFYTPTPSDPFLRQRMIHEIITGIRPCPWNQFRIHQRLKQLANADIHKAAMAEAA